jgi:predicted ATP-dependent serine protease
MRVRCHQCRSQYPLDMGRCPTCGVDFRQALATPVPPSAHPEIKIFNHRKGI